MRNAINRLVLICICLAFIAAVPMGCKSKQKSIRNKVAVEAEQKNRIEKAKQTLSAIVSGESKLSLKEKEAEIEAIKNEGLHDAELSELLAAAEVVIKEERNKAEKTVTVTASNKDKPNGNVSVTAATNATESKLNTLFDKIASGSEADKNTKEVKSLFASDDVPVLIIIRKDASITDYDRPTTIGKYLDYLKDHGISRNKVFNVSYDDNNKITEIELIRK